MGTICVVLRLTLMTREVATPSSVLCNLHSTPSRYKACWEVIAEEAGTKKTWLVCLIGWHRGERAGNW